MKTDLTRILAISGQSGLYLYISQARNGAIVEAKLQQVLLNIKDVLGDADAPSSKAPADELKALFEKALPDYDRDRFYVSHMKKVVDWYNSLKKYASLDFVDPEEAEETEQE